MPCSSSTGAPAPILALLSLPGLLGEGEAEEEVLGDPVEKQQPML